MSATNSRIVVLVLILANMLDLLPGKILPISILLGTALLCMEGAVPTVVAFSLFLSPCLTLLSNTYSFSATLLVAVLLIPLQIVLVLLHRNDRSQENNSEHLPLFIIWAFVFFAVMVTRGLLGPLTEYRLHWLQYLTVYGTFYGLSGILVVIKRIPASHIVLPGLFYMSFVYPLMEMSFLAVPSMATSEIGLRAWEEFGAISVPRLGGMLVAAAIVCRNTDKRGLFRTSILVLSLALAVPLIVYGYTRQVYLGVLVVVGVYLFKRLCDTKYSRSKRIALISANVLAIVAAGMLFLDVELLSTSRIVTDDALSNSRFTTWHEAWEMILEQPFLGYHVGYFGEHGNSPWVHNWYLEAWLEHGLIGLLLFLVATYFFLRLWILVPINHPLYGWGLLALFQLTVVQFSGDIARNSIMLFFVCVALAWRVRSPKPENKHVFSERLYVEQQTANTVRW